MPKFYVQCGPVEIVLHADCIESAAISALDCHLQTHTWIYDDDGLTEQDCRDHLLLESLMHLDPAIRVSERGFDRDDAAEIGTPETVYRWHRLMIAVRRMYETAGIGQRRVWQRDVMVDGKRIQPRLPR